MEKIAFVYSIQDPAGINIFEQIKKIGLPAWSVFYEVEEDLVSLNLGKIKENKIVFLSKHKSEAGTKSLTVHMTGNFGEARFGGKSRELSYCATRLGGNYLRALNEENQLSGLIKKGFTVSLEVTHHGPLSNKECVFIELGSSPQDWKNELGARVIAKTIIETTLKENTDKIVIGLGGGHYAPDFTKLCLRKQYSFGHICPKHQLENLNKELLDQMIQKSKATEIILDWKGLKEYKERVVSLCEKTGLTIQRVQNLLK